MKKNMRLNGTSEIGRSVERSLDEYFRKLDGEPPHCVYDMVITHVERALDHAGLEVTVAAEPAPDRRDPVLPAQRLRIR